MSLVVIVASNAPEGLVEQLETLGYDAVTAANPQLAVDLCRRQQATLVLSTAVEDAEFVAAAHLRVPIVVIFEQPVSKDTLLQLMRDGVADVWEEPLADGFVAERITLLRHRGEALVLQAERELAQHLADLERDQRAGRYIQMGMLPPSPMAVEGYRFSHRIEPSLILSGDFVDYFRITDRYFGVYVADVSGHGASSAFVTVLLKNFSRRLRREYRPSMLRDPGEILTWLNRELLEQQIDKHVTLFLAIGDLEQNSLRYVNAGHYPPAILVSEQNTCLLELQGKPIGLFEDVSYQCASVTMQPGDRLVVFSDGVLELMADKKLEESERALMQIAREQADIDGIWNQLNPTDLSLNPDDMTCLILTREA